MSSLEPSNTDIIDIQDRIGYVDTGPTQSILQPSTTTSSSRNISNNNQVATSSTSHLTIKEPKPQRQVHILNDNSKKRSSTIIGYNNSNNKPEIGQESIKASYHSTQPTQHRSIRKSNSMETGGSSHGYPLNVPPLQSTNNNIYYNDSNKRSPKVMVTNGMENSNNRTPYVHFPPTTTTSSSSSAPIMTTTTSAVTGTNNEEIKERMVCKLYELAEMLKSLNMEDQIFDKRLEQEQQNYYHHQQRQQGPRPTPSKSDPSHQQPQPYQPIRRRTSSRKKYIVPPSPPEVNRQQYNKSADASIKYQDHHNSRPSYHDYDDYGYYSHQYYDPQPPPPPPEMMYDETEYYGSGGYIDDPPYQPPTNRYGAPPLPSVQRPIYGVAGRPRRKSYNNLRDEDILQQQHHHHQRLSRKSSRGNMARHLRQPPVMYDPYHPQGEPPLPPPPSRYHPSYYQQYSPDPPYYG